MDVITKCLIGVIALLLIIVVMVISVIINEIKERKNLEKTNKAAWAIVEKLNKDLKQAHEIVEQEKNNYENIILAKDIEISNLNKIIEKKKKASEKKRAEAISQALKKRKEQRKDSSEREESVPHIIQQRCENEDKTLDIDKLEVDGDEEPKIAEIQKTKVTVGEGTLSNGNGEAPANKIEQSKDNKKRKRK